MLLAIRVLGAQCLRLHCVMFQVPFSEPFDLSSTPSCWLNTGGESWVPNAQVQVSTYAAER